MPVGASNISAGLIRKRITWVGCGEWIWEPGEVAVEGRLFSSFILFEFYILGMDYLFKS